MLSKSDQVLCYGDYELYLFFFVGLFLEIWQISHFCADTMLKATTE